MQGLSGLELVSLNLLPGLLELVCPEAVRVREEVEELVRRLE